MGFHVKNTAKATRDLDLILARLVSEHAGETGLRWFQGLKDAATSLAKFPERCPLAPENREFPFEVRQLLYGRRSHTYRILFTIEADTVVVLHIRHGRRMPVAH